ncbi:MAG: hypothetical protein IJT05_06790 [Lachnospiraceae bacterium]|nr:hypothetical protein [Lachnospiraceae bacterium]
MCRTLFVVNKLMLGNRELGWELFDGEGVLEQTSRQIKDAIKKGERVYGLKMDKEENLVLDTDGFFTTDLMLHSHINSFKSMTGEANVTNKYLVCTGSRMAGGKKVYSAVSSRFEQITNISEEEMKVFLKLGICTSGARLVGNEIEVATVKEEKAGKGSTKQLEKKEVELKASRAAATNQRETVSVNKEEEG